MKVFRKFISKIKKQSGYTLAELSISTSIIAMLAVGGLSIMGKKNESDRVNETSEKLTTIETALKSYIRTNKFVPCPALPNVLESNTTFGKSVSYNTTTHVCDGSSLANGTGAVPVRTLNLDDEYTYDGWGRKFTYRTSDSSGAQADFDIPQFHGDLAIVDMKGVNKTDINELPPFNNGAIYVVISHGSNGKDVTYGKNTTTEPSSLATGFEKVNTDHTVKTYVQAPKSNTFDDMVIYGMKKKIMPPRNIAAPIQIDALACENAHAVLLDSRSNLDSFASSTTTASADALYKSARKIATLCDNAPTTELRPASLTNLALWLDADDPLTIYGTTSNSNSSADCSTGPAPVTGSFIGCWKDKSGFDRNAIQASTATNRPIYTTAQINGKPILNFTATNQSYYTSAVPSPYITSAGLTYIMVAKRTGTGTSVSAFNALGSGQSTDYTNATSFAGFYETAGTTLAGYRNNAAKSSATHPGNNIAYIATGIFDGTNHTMYLNGTGQTPVASTGNFSIATFYIGSRVGASATTYNGNIAEIIVYDRALTTGERQGIESYLSSKWAIAVTGASQQCPPGLTFQKTAAVPQGSCQCPAGQVLFQELNNSSACFAGSNVTFNKCVSNPDTFATYTAPPPTAGMGLWLDANDCSTIKLSPGSKVNKWLDKSPAINSVISTTTSNSAAGNNVMQNIDSYRPIYVPNALNAKGIIRFDGNDFLSSSSAITNPPTDDVSVLAVAAIKAPAAGSSPTVAKFGSTVGNLGWNLYYLSSGTYNPSYIVKRNDSWGTDLATHNTLPPASTTTMNYVLLTGVSSNGKTTIYVNGQGISVPSNGGTMQYGSNPVFNIGSNLNGDIAEIISYNRALTTNERVAIERYMGHKWKLFFDPVSPKDPITPFALNNGIANNLALWVDASDTANVFPTNTCSGTTSNEGDSVGCLADKSPNGYNITKTATTNRPKYSLSRINGKPGVIFDGTTSFMTNSSVPFATGTWSGATVFVVFQDALATPVTQQTVLSISATTSSIYNFAAWTSSGAFGINDGVANTIKGRLVSSLVPTPELMTSPHIYALQFTSNDTGTNSKIWVDGIEPGTQSTPAYTTSGTITGRIFSDGITIGALNNASPTLYAQMDLGEIILYSNVGTGTYMTDLDRKKIEAYLSSKWNIAVTP